ncbi:MAG: hypothetical protein ACREC6_01440 [Hyphomicrobiaceae bacterium]
MQTQSTLAGRAVAISVSESPDLPVLGLDPRHLQEAMAEIARYLLANGSRLLYGGDLRPGGFTELLSELVARRRPEEADAKPAVANFLPWPVHMSLSPDEVGKWADGLGPHVELVCLSREGGTISPARRAKLKPAAPTPADWSRGLSSMRKVLTKLSEARVILGGRVEGYKGKMPGLAEEALASLEAGKPIYISGGFGGCAGDIAETMGLTKPSRSKTARTVDWAGRSRFAAFGANDLNNGLSADKNGRLARTARIEEAVASILEGLNRLSDNRNRHG